MPSGKRLSFGVKTAPQYTTYDEILRVWKSADATPVFEHAWLFDHFMPVTMDPTGPVLEGWTLLAALAAQTERVRVGIMVSSNTFRHPALLAKEGATVDRISRGRLDFGIGAGWHEMEHTAYGIPLNAPGERIQRLGEACEVVLKLWTEEVATFDGQYYQLRDAHFEPKPVQQPHPPIVIGGSGEKRTLRVVARYADIWNFAAGTLDEFRHKNAVLDEHCRAIGRDPAAIERSVQYVVDPAQLTEAREALAGFVGAGATHVVLYLRAPFPSDIVRRLAAEVAGPLRGNPARGGG
jgi:F420-dependent oxidoreductase-like protein